MELGAWARNLTRNSGTIAEAGKSGNLKVLASMLGPAFRGLVLQRGKAGDQSQVSASHRASFDWAYEREQPALARLYSAAKTSQWDSDTALDWSIEVDAHRPNVELIADSIFPL